MTTLTIIQIYDIFIVKHISYIAWEVLPCKCVVFYAFSIQMIALSIQIDALDMYMNVDADNIAYIVHTYHSVLTGLWVQLPCT